MNAVAEVWSVYKMFTVEQAVTDITPGDHDNVNLKTKVIVVKTRRLLK